MRKSGSGAGRPARGGARRPPGPARGHHPLAAPPPTPWLGGQRRAWQPRPPAQHPPLLALPPGRPPRALPGHGRGHLPSQGREEALGRGPPARRPAGQCGPGQEVPLLIGAGRGRPDGRRALRTYRPSRSPGALVPRRARRVPRRRRPWPAAPRKPRPTRLHLQRAPPAARSHSHPGPRLQLPRTPHRLEVLRLPLCCVSIAASPHEVGGGGRFPGGWGGRGGALSSCHLLPPGPCRSCDPEQRAGKGTVNGRTRPAQSLSLKFRDMWD